MANFEVINYNEDLKRRIQNIILLALLANLGLICFQVYWLRNIYVVNKVSFEKDIREALNKAMEQLRVIEAKPLFLLGNSKYEYSPMDTTTLEVLNFKDTLINASDKDRFYSLKDSLKKWNLDSLAKDRNRQKVKFNAIIEVSDSLPRQVKGKKLQVNVVKDSAFVLETKKFIEKVYLNIISKAVDLQVLDSLFELQLSQRLINTNYRFELYKEDSLYAELDHGSVFKPAFTIKNNDTLAPFVQELQAHFPKQTLFLLKKMGLAIAVSLFLISIMLASFLYMINIIFKQKQLAEIKNDFINNMTHELKTPISILSTANEALLNFKALEDRNKTLRYLGIFQKELDRLTSMVEKVLNISVYEKDSFSLKKETVNLEEMIQELISRYKVPREKPIQINFDNQLTHPILKVDRIHFYNVLNNLFDNAIKYSKEEILINIKAYDSDKNLLIEIEDKGIGIAKSHQRSIFEKFYRVPTGNLHNVKGFGLGLNYVKRIIEKHQGNIDLISELNQGSTFIISLPKI